MFDVGFIKIKFEIYKIDVVLFLLEVVDVYEFDFLFSKVKLGIVDLDLMEIEVYLWFLLDLVMKIILVDKYFSMYLFFFVIGGMRLLDEDKFKVIME